MAEVRQCKDLADNLRRAGDERLGRWRPGDKIGVELFILAQSYAGVRRAKPPHISWVACRGFLREVVAEGCEDTKASVWLHGWQAAFTRQELLALALGGTAT